jgi:hypothetical protein
MRKHWFLRGLKILAVVAVAATVLSFVVMFLWNYLMPTLFSLHAISFWQAFGLLVLCKILFRGWGPPFMMHWRRRMMERWEQMTPEEREKFRLGMRGGCGAVGSSPAAPKA